MKMGYWITALIVLVSALFVAAYFIMFERVTRENAETVFSQAALSNPVLAAMNMLEKMGCQTSRLKRLSLGNQRLDGLDVLFLMGGEGELSQRQSNLLLDWVEAGGLLIATVDTGASIGERQNVYDGIFRDHLDFDVFQKEANQARVKQQAVWLRAERRLDLELQTPWRIKWRTAAYQDDDPGFRILPGGQALPEQDPGIENGFWASRGLGNGWIIYQAGYQWMTNKHIGRLDHAEHLTRMLQLHPNPRRIWFVFDQKFPHLFIFIWQYAWMVVVSLALLLVYVFAWRAPRFGPVAPAPQPVRRSLGEHIYACGAFLWRHDGKEQLLQATRAAMFARLAATHAEWVNLKPEQLAAHLAPLTGLQAGSIAAVLAEEQPVINATHFMNQIQVFETIRRAL